MLTDTPGVMYRPAAASPASLALRAANYDVPLPHAFIAYRSSQASLASCLCSRSRSSSSRTCACSTSSRLYFEEQGAQQRASGRQRALTYSLHTLHLFAPPPPSHRCSARSARPSSSSSSSHALGGAGGRSRHRAPSLQWAYFCATSSGGAPRANAIDALRAAPPARRRTTRDRRVLELFDEGYTADPRDDDDDDDDDDDEGEEGEEEGEGKGEGKGDEEAWARRRRRRRRRRGRRSTASRSRRPTGGPLRRRRRRRGWWRRCTSCCAICFGAGGVATLEGVYVWGSSLLASLAARLTKTESGEWPFDVT